MCTAPAAWPRVAVRPIPPKSPWPASPTSPPPPPAASRDVLRWKLVDRSPAAASAIPPATNTRRPSAKTTAPSSRPPPRRRSPGSATPPSSSASAASSSRPIRSGPTASRASSPAAPRPASRSTSLPPLDVVIVSHNHCDHLDLPTLAPHRQRRRSTSCRSATRRSCATPGSTSVVELDWWQIPPGRRPRDHRWCPRATGRCAQPWNRNDMLVGRLRGSRARGRRLPLGRHRAASTASPRSASASAPSTGRCCRSAPTSRAGSWSRST